MYKKRYKLILLVLSMLIIINSINAASKTYTYTHNNNPISNSKLYIYSCTDSSCSSLSSSYWNTPTLTSTSSITINGISSSYNKEFHYIDCYTPKEYIRLDIDYDGNSRTIEMPKQISCPSSLSTITVSGTKQVNNELIFSVNLGQVFTSSLTALPNEVKSFYDATVDVKLSIKDANHIEVYTKTDSITVSFGGKTTTFTWTPSQAGDYDISITTNVKDCKCIQPQQDSSPTTKSITINPSQPACTSQCSTLNEKRCYNSTILQTCTKIGDCNYWSNLTCPANQVCYNNICTASSQSCTPLWICSAYSSCAENQQTQTRICEDTSNCNDLSTKPIEVQSCLTQTLPSTCTENWICSDWSSCSNSQQTRECVDTNGCSPERTESNPCDNESIITNEENQKSPAQQFNEQTNATVNLMLAKIAEGIQQIIETNKYSLAILFLIVVVIMASSVYYLNTHKDQIFKIKPKQKKSDKKPVKVNDLMISVIDSLEADERELCYALLENEGMTEDELKNKTSLSKSKMEIALTKLERRQVIKKREGENSKLYFNDWLK